MELDNEKPPCAGDRAEGGKDVALVTANIQTSFESGQNQALAFLKGHTAGWPDSWYLQVVAIEPKRDKDHKPGIKAISVPPSEIDTLPSWIRKWHGKRNLYFCVNPLRHRKDDKALKADIAALAYLHVDLDPRKEEPLEAERQRLLADVESFPLKPSELVMSGNGWGAFWRLQEPIPVNGNVDELGQINKRLAQHFDGDNCHNIDRIMRLPGTLNLPGHTKIERGCVPVMAELVSQSDIAYRLDNFSFLPPLAPTGTKGKQGGMSGTASTHELPERFWQLVRDDIVLAARWAGGVDGLKDASRSGLDMSLTSLLVFHGFNDAEVVAILHAFPHGKVAQDGRGITYVEPMLAKARSTRLVLAGDPMTTARRLLAERFTTPEGVVLLREWRGDGYLWSGGLYQQVGDSDLTAIVSTWLEGARVAATGKKKKAQGSAGFATTAYCPTSHKVKEVLQAIKTVVHLHSGLVPPCRLDDGSRAMSLLACHNGVLDLHSRELLPHDPARFIVNGVPFDYERQPDPPMAWLKFLHQLWPGDPESIETLQEWYGYCLTTDTSRQKIMMLVGPKRAGKGVIAQVLRAMVGEANCCAPTLASLNQNFGLAPLIGKSVAIIADARLGRGADQKVVAERLLSISGQDDLTIDRKFREAWTGRLGVRVTIMTNELPTIEDGSGALASRFLVLRLTQSWYGREDLGLVDRLMEELPGILAWALRGLDRLRARGQFRQPATAMKLIEELEELGSPIKTFLRECCVITPDAEVEIGQLYQRWKFWCQSQGRDHPGTAQVFGRDLRSAIPTLGNTQPRINGVQKRLYTGVGLKGGNGEIDEKMSQEFFKGHKTP